jgi:di-heme cytochrome c peroxidase
MTRTIPSAIAAVALAVPLLAAWNALADPAPPTAAGLRAFIAQRVGGIVKLQVPTRNEDLPQPRLADGRVDPRYQITEAKRYLGKLLFFDPVRANRIRPEFGGAPFAMQSASCGSCHTSVAGSKAGQVINFATGGEGFGYTEPDGRFVIRRRARAGLVDLIPTPMQKLDAAGHVVMDGRFDPVDSCPRLAPTLIGFAFNNRLLLGGKAGEPFDPSNPQKANANPSNLPAGESLAQIAFDAHRMLETQQHALQGVAVYRRLFQEAFPDEYARSLASGNLDDLMNDDTVGRAVATFARTVITRHTPWDRFLAGDDGALTARQLRGAQLFVTAASDGGAGCISCHSGPALNKRLGDESGQGVETNFHNIGIGDHPLQALARQALDDPNFHDVGRAEVTANPADAFKFKAPCLRQIRDGRQYTHAGVFQSVREVVEYFNAGVPLDRVAASAGNVSPLFTHPRAPDVTGLHLSPGDVDALVDFLENGLYDPAFVKYDPRSPTDTFEPNVRDLSYSGELHALGAVDGLLPSHMNLGSNDPLSRRDRGLEFLDAGNMFVATSMGITFPLGRSPGLSMLKRQTWRITNRTDQPIDGDILLVLDAMSPNVKILNAEGVTTRMEPIGMPYLRIRPAGGQVAPGASITAEIEFTGTGRLPQQYHFHVMCGAGVP